MEIYAGELERSMLLLENRLQFLRSPVEARGPGGVVKYCSWKRAQGNCTHASAVIGGEGVRAEGPAQTWRAGGRARGQQNTHIYDEKRIFDVFSRESKSKSASWSQSRLGPNLGRRKSLQNTIEISYFDVFDVAKTMTF